MIHVYTGDGKGKTTAAVGLALRGAGHGLKTVFLSFLKEGTSGEVCAAASMGHLDIKCYQTTVHGFFCNLTPEEKIRLKTETQKGFLFAMQCAKEKSCHTLVLDEIAGALTNGLLSEQDVLAYLSAYGKDMEIVLTGRNFPESILDMADYISEIHAKKHPYENDTPARKGIEF